MDEQGHTVDDLANARTLSHAERAELARRFRADFGAFDPRKESAVAAAAIKTAKAYAGVEPDARDRLLIADGIIDDAPESWRELVRSVELTLGLRRHGKTKP